MSGSLSIFPTSPVPGNLGRDPMWGETTQTYDSGQEQASTPWVKPLMRYSMDFSNFPRSKQSSVAAFYNTVKGRTLPWAFKDPYDFRANATICVQSGTGVRSFFVRTREGYPVIPDSGALVIVSALSGTLNPNSHYSFNGVTGVFSTRLAPSSADTWTASCEYFRKCKFDSYQEKSPIWEIFNGTLSWHEISLP